jgi:CubicO group peptidase (beta-lactamase class C family)/streptogramin lyase
MLVNFLKTWIGRGTKNRRSRVTPSIDTLERRALLTGVVTGFPIPTADSAPLGVTATSDGKIWFTESASAGGKIGQFSSSTGSFNEELLPTIQGRPQGITVGPDGNLWFTELGLASGPGTDGAPSQIGELKVSTGAISEYPTPTVLSGPKAIVSGPDGNLYFTEYQETRSSQGTSYRSAIGVVDLSGSTPTISELTVPDDQDNPSGIALGADGNIWFTARNTNHIVRLDLANNTFTSFLIPTALSGPLGITSGPDGALWFTEIGANQLGSILPVAVTTSAAITVPSDATVTLPSKMTFGPGSTISAGTLLPVGTFEEYTLPAGGTGPDGITATSDGHLWCTLNTSDGVLDLDPSTGGTTLYPSVDHPGEPSGIVASNGLIWFDDTEANTLDAVQFSAPWYTRTTVSSTIPAVGQAGTFTATVSSHAAGSPSGQVVFTLDGTAQAPISLDGTTSVSFTPAGLAAGTHVVTASYLGDPAFLPSLSNTAYTIVQAANEPPVEAAVDSAVAAALRQYNLSGMSVAVIEAGQPAVVKGYGLADASTGQIVTAETPFEIASVTKTYTAVAVLLLAQDPSLVAKPLSKPFNINEPIVNYLSDDPTNGFTLPDTWKPVTTAQLLAMSSGIPDNGTSFLTWQQILQNTGTEPLVAPPGTSYLYSDPAFILLGELIQQLSDEDYATFLRQNVLDPLGVSDNTVIRSGTETPSNQAVGYTAYDTSSGLWQVPSAYRPGSSSFSSGAISTTAIDMATYLAGLIQGKILSTMSYAEMFAPVPLLSAAPPHDQVVRGLGWDSVTQTLDGPMIAKNGGLPGFAAEYVLWPEKDIAVGVIVNQVGFPILKVNEAIYDAIQAARTATTSRLVASQASVTVGEPIRFTVQVLRAAGGVPGGNVVFTVDGVAQTPVALATVGGVATATLDVPNLAVGAHVVTTQYLGSVEFSPSASDPFVVTVAKPDGPRVLSVVRIGRFYQPTRLVLTFDQPLNPASAQKLANYSVSIVRIGTVSHRLIIGSATYHAGSGTVTLRFRSRLPLRLPYRLVVNGTGSSGVEDTAGRLLDGQGTGSPGSNYTTIVTVANYRAQKPERPKKIGVRVHR